LNNASSAAAGQCTLHVSELLVPDAVSEPLELSGALLAQQLAHLGLGAIPCRPRFAQDPIVAGVRYVVIETEHDEVVTPFTNAFLNGSGVTNITVQGQCPNDPVAHIGMFDDSPSLQNLLNQLGSSPNRSFKATCSKLRTGHLAVIPE
jgi:hypothetical protein